LQEFTNWTLKTIREDKYIGSWLEERKFDWIPIMAKTVTNIIDKGKTILLVTDSGRNWFAEYLLSKINSSQFSRPHLPIYDFYGMLRGDHHFSNDMDIELIKDMLDISFPNGYIFWYIGKSNSKKAVLPKVTSGSFLWLFDEDYQNSFNMKSTDETLDMKLMQLYRLFDKTIDATLFGEIEVDK
jgi:hypothetical protein